MEVFRDSDMHEKIYCKPTEARNEGGKVLSITASARVDEVKGRDKANNDGDQ